MTTTPTTNRAQENRHIVWFSCGAASTITASLVLKEHPDAILAYCDTGGEHPDNARFMKDVESYLKTKVVVLRTDKFKDHMDVCQKTKYINGPGGARCTVELKKSQRFKFQQADDIQYFGYTCEETHRAERFCKSFPEVKAKFPLIEKGLSKEQCLGMLWKAKIEIPLMYHLGFNNNNCIGCVKGGAGYWNKIRSRFPDQFERMAKIEREVGASCLKSYYLDELPIDAGNHNDTQISCDFVCQSQEKL